MSEQAAAVEVLEEIESAVRNAFSDFSRGTVRALFMAFATDIEYSISTTGFDEADEPKLAAALEVFTDSVSLTNLKELRESMVTVDRGAWLHAEISFDCLTEEMNHLFNYDKRFNSLAQDWAYHDEDAEVVPNRQMLLNDLKRHPRAPEHVPAWYAELEREQAAIEALIESTDPEELFAEQIELVPDLSEYEDKLAANALWLKVWEDLGAVYVKELLKREELRRAFVESDSLKAQAEAVFDGLEPKVLDEFLLTFLNENDADEQAAFLSALADARGDNENTWEGSEEEWDLELLAEDLEEVFEELIVEQTKQRFPDLSEQE